MIHTTMVASARTVHRISPTANASSCLLTAWNANRNSGITVPNHMTNIPMRIGLIQIVFAISMPDITAKCAPTSKREILPKR